MKYATLFICLFLLVASKGSREIKKNINLVYIEMIKEDEEDEEE